MLGTTDVHNYDGMYQSRIKELSTKLKSDKEKIKAFSILRLYIANSRNAKALSCFDIISKDHATHNRIFSSPNFDSVNKLYACDLLYLCYEKVHIERNHDFLKELIIQLEGMTTGLCPQGRNTRLFQILVAFP